MSTTWNSVRIQWTDNIAEKFTAAKQTSISFSTTPFNQKSNKINSYILYIYIYINTAIYKYFIYYTKQIARGERRRIVLYYNLGGTRGRIYCHKFISIENQIFLLSGSRKKNRFKKKKKKMIFIMCLDSCRWCLSIHNTHTYKLTRVKHFDV